MAKSLWKFEVIPDDQELEIKTFMSPLLAHKYIKRHPGQSFTIRSRYPDDERIFEHSSRVWTANGLSVLFKQLVKAHRNKRTHVRGIARLEGQISAVNG